MMRRKKEKKPELCIPFGYSTKLERPYAGKTRCIKQQWAPTSTILTPRHARTLMVHLAFSAISRPHWLPKFKNALQKANLHGLDLQCSTQGGLKHYNTPRCDDDLCMDATGAQSSSYAGTKQTC